MTEQIERSVRVRNKCLQYIIESDRTYKNRMLSGNPNMKTIRGKEYVVSSHHNLTNSEEIKKYHKNQIQRLQRLGYNVRISSYMDKNGRVTFTIWRSKISYI